MRKGRATNEEENTMQTGNQGTTAGEALVAKVQALYAAFGRGDVEAIAAMTRPDVEWRYEVDYRLPGVPPTLGPFRGHEGVRAYFAAVGAHLDVKKLAPVAFLGAPGRVAVLAEKQIDFRRTGRGYGGLLVHLFEFDPEGRIARHVHFDDTATILAAWGDDAKIQIVQRIYEAFGQGDVATILSLVHEDVDWASCPGSTVAPWHGVIRGKAALPRFFEALGRVQVTRFEPTMFAANGTEVTCVIRFGLRVPSTGKSGEMEIHHLWRFRDGKVAYYRGTEDTALTASLFG
ncbi:MAG: nuclear transport factor 2 family protein [Sandaracinus sp.]